VIRAARGARCAAIASIAAIAAAVCIGCDDKGGARPAVRAQAITVGTALAAEQVLTRSLDAAPSTLDPSLATDVYAQCVLDDLFEGLTTQSPDGHIVPGVASSWDVSADGKIWLFHLRPTARWSNGEPLTARDFVYAWRRTVDPRTAASYAQSVAPVENAFEIATGKRPVTDLGVEALDAHTLRVRLSAPAPYFPAVLADAWMYPQYEPAIKRYGDDWTRPEHIVGNGPFTLREHVVGNRLTLERSPYYWDAAAVKLNRVVYDIIDDRNAQAQRFLAGQLQFVYTFPTTDRPWLAQQLGDQVVTGPVFSTLMVGFNMQKPPFQHNRALRLALAMAFDRNMIAQHVLYGAGYPTSSIMPPLEGYEQQLPDWAGLPAPQRYALARRLYHEAGYSVQHPLQVEMTYPSGDPVTELVYEALAGMWRESLGAEVTLHPEEFKVLLQNNRLHQNLLFHNGWFGDFPDPYTFMQLYTSGFDLNYNGYSNPRYDALVEAAGHEPDNDKRYRLFEQAERMLNDEAINVPVYYYASRHLIKPYVKGWASNSFDRNLSRYMYLLEHKGN
jgi:oligopeptide transport system substrate-binding protein